MTRPSPSRARLAAAAAAGCATVLGLGAVTPAGAAPLASASANLIKDPGAEAAQVTGHGPGSLPGWVRAQGSLRALRYGASGGFPKAGTPGPASRGKKFFTGGPNNAGGTSVATQTIPLAAESHLIAQGAARYTIAGWFGGFWQLGVQANSMGLEVTFKDTFGNVVADQTIGFPAPEPGVATYALTPSSATGSVPAAATVAYLQLIGVHGGSGNVIRAFADNLSLHISPNGS